MNANLETRDLRLVQAIAEAGGATSAAKRLHLSQSAVSHQLRGLEERLGLELFRRNGRRLFITSAGQRLVDLANQVLVPILQLELELKRGLLRERPKLRVGTQCYTAYHWLPSALQALTSEHPEVELSLSSEALGDAAAAIADKSLDLALCVVPPQRGKLSHVRLFDDELVLAVPRGHALARRKFVTGADLANETLVQYNVSTVIRERLLKQLFGNRERPVRHFLRVPSIEPALDLVQAGMGLSIVANVSIAARLSRGELEAVRLTQRGFRRTWHGVFRAGSALEGPIKTLLGSIRSRAPVSKA
jgi:LysR family transcriptional regulator for metE and metH